MDGEINHVWGQSKIDDRSCVPDTGFNCGALCSFNWMVRYSDYLAAIYPQIPKLHIYVEKGRGSFSGIRNLTTQRVLL